MPSGDGDGAYDESGGGTYQMSVALNITPRGFRILGYHSKRIILRLVLMRTKYVL